MSVRTRRHTIVDSWPRDQLNPVLTALGALYTALLVNHTLLQPDLQVAPLAFLSSGTLLLFIGSRWLLSHRELSVMSSESLSSTLAGAVILHSFLHLYLLSNFSETRSLVLLGLGILTFFLSLRRLTIILAVTLAVWVIVAAVGGPSAAWLYFAFGLFIATGLKLYSVINRSDVATSLATAEETQKRCREVEEVADRTGEQLELALDSSEEGFWRWNLEEGDLETTPRFNQMLGLETPVTRASQWLGRLRASHRPRIELLHRSVTVNRPRFDEECEVLHADGTYRWVRVRGMAHFDDDEQPVCLAGWQADITQFKTMQRKLYQRSFRDELTGLSNRQLFLRQIEGALQQTHQASPEYGVVVLVLDIDRFRRHIDRSGYGFADDLLKVVSQRLQARVGALSVARLEADRFGLLFSKLVNPLAAQGVAATVRQVMALPFGEGESALQLSGSMGLAWGQLGVPPATLLCRAHRAMRQAKSRGPGRYVVYDEETEGQHEEQLELEFRLAAALRRGELVLVYQPVTALKNGRIVGVAAQLRWNHPSRGLLFPEQFQEAVRASGLEAAVAWWSLREALKRMKGWLAKDPANPLFSISLPVAARQFSDLGAVDRVFELLQQFQLAPEMLRLEVTEATIEAQPANVLPMLSELQDGGVQIHLSSFGTRQASPAVLEEFDFDALKLAPEFVEGIEHIVQKRQAAGALLKMASEMAVDSIAEGLDSARQVEVVESLGCDYGQGSFFWPAMDQEMLEAILADGEGKRPAEVIQMAPPEARR